MPIFPDTPRPNGPYQWHWDHATILTRNAQSGKTQSRPGRSFDLLYATITYPTRPIADYAALRSFCRWAQGQNRRFTFKDFNGTAASYSSPPLAPWPVDATLGLAGYGSIPCTMVSDGSFALGDGATLTFDLPFSNLPGAVVGTNVTVWDNYYATSNYSISLGTGTDGRDQVVFAGGHAPALGHIISASAPSARLTIYARFGNDSFAANTTVGSGGPITPNVTIVQDP